ncbi:fascin domain-containing protein [Paenibacillus puerhi]|uniref:fascin domain-containing protein n=1 Tax=Paenibacillus puerhi TaxID=2692622 RepID=UPI001358BC03|nr:RICIN domain-containing protein [Paenibacillus puerhi]
MAQMSYVQHKGDSSFEDLYDYASKLLLKGVEYTASYNLGNTVPFTPVYTSSNNTWNRVESVVSTVNRSQNRPVYTMVWNHYKHVKGLADSTSSHPVYYTRLMSSAIWPESTHTDHQPLSTLMYSRASRAANTLSHTISINVKETTNYLTAPDSGANPLLADVSLAYYKSNATNTEKFLATYVGGGAWTLKSNANNKYVSASSETSPLQALDTSVVDNRNKFLFIDQGNGGVAIKSVATGKYIQVVSATGQLLANETNLSSSAVNKFRLMYH